MQRGVKLAGEVQVEQGKRQVAGEVMGLEKYCWEGRWYYWLNQELHSGCCCFDPAKLLTHTCACVMSHLQ